MIHRHCTAMKLLAYQLKEAYRLLHLASVLKTGEQLQAAIHLRDVHSEMTLHREICTECQEISRLVKPERPADSRSFADKAH